MRKECGQQALKAALPAQSGSLLAGGLGPSGFFQSTWSSRRRTGATPAARHTTPHATLDTRGPKGASVALRRPRGVEPPGALCARSAASRAFARAWSLKARKPGSLRASGPEYGEVTMLQVPASMWLGSSKPRSPSPEPDARTATKTLALNVHIWQNAQSTELRALLRESHEPLWALHGWLMPPIADEFAGVVAETAMGQRAMNPPKMSQKADRHDRTVGAPLLGSLPCSLRSREGARARTSAGSEGRAPRKRLARAGAGRGALRIEDAKPVPGLPAPPGSTIGTSRVRARALGGGGVAGVRSHGMAMGEAKRSELPSRKPKRGKRRALRRPTG